MPTNGDLRDLDRITVERSATLVRQARITDFDRPTPCAGWNLGDLVEHMAAQHRGFAAAAAGQGAEPGHWTVRPTGADAVEHYTAAADEVLAAFAALHDLSVKVWIPELSATRQFRAGQAIGFHLVDYVGHAWDVAQTLGLPLDLPDEAIAAALPIMREAPDGPERREPGATFGPVQPITRDDPLHEFLALIGRIG
jgi:uncharacterized protein (TIGR03086 family)